MHWLFRCLALGLRRVQFMNPYEEHYSIQLVNRSNPHLSLFFFHLFNKVLLEFIPKIGVFGACLFIPLWFLVHLRVCNWIIKLNLFEWSTTPLKSLGKPMSCMLQEEEGQSYHLGTNLITLSLSYSLTTLSSFNYNSLLPLKFLIRPTNYPYPVHTQIPNP